MTKDFDNDKKGETNKIGLLGLIASACSAFIGIQSDKKRKKDFASDQFWSFVIIGVVFVLFLVILISAFVNIVLINADAN